MANLWRSLERVIISNLGRKCSLFKFYHDGDIDWVFIGALWTSNNHLLIFHRLEDKKDPSQNERRRKEDGIWMGSYSEATTQKGFLEEFGKDFMEYDSEDRPILRIEGKKRPINDSQVPYSTDLLILEEYNDEISTAARWQTSYTQ
ncbi:hypothetical protein J1N35_014036 [Gossypium stocksii]|uniref:DUF4283 domain-containing protein n=1 Tax=Gossypium stocksii TaxID=47602 RepID=A0A9D4A8H4_9ROSI|nr:hypothetical protein J1N35_014036 [Gossypium stocksii]